MRDTPAPLLCALDDSIGRLGPLGAGHSLAAISRLGRCLPPTFQAFGFECRLAASRQEVDFGLRADARRGDYRGLADAAARGRLPRHPVWRRIAALASLWCDVGRDASLSHFFLEFDTSRERPQAGAPSVFLRTCAGRRDLEVRKSTEAAWMCLKGRLPTAREGERLARCFDALPDDGVLLDLGLMLGRAEGRPRVHVSLPLHGVDGYLEALGAEAQRDTLHTVFDEFGVDRFGHRLDGVELQLEVDGGVGSRIGVEYGFPCHPDADRAAEWAALLERLQKAGLCSEEKRRALLAWPGARHGDGVVYDTSHVKLVVCAGRPLAAKAYVHVEPDGRDHG